MHRYAQWSDLSFGRPGSLLKTCIESITCFSENSGAGNSMEVHYGPFLQYFWGQTPAGNHRKPQFNPENEPDLSC